MRSDLFPAFLAFWRGTFELGQPPAKSAVFSFAAEEAQRIAAFRTTSIKFARTVFVETYLVFHTSKGNIIGLKRFTLFSSAGDKFL